MADPHPPPAVLDLNDVAPVPARLDLEALVARLRDGAAGWVPRLFPQGRREGEEWRLANIEGEAPRKAGSCVVHLQGPHAGDWYDFARREGGGPLNALEKATGLAGRELFALAAELAGPAPPSPPARRPARDDAREMDFILSRAMPLAGTPAEAWLAARGLVPVACPDLLFHPDLTCWDTRTGWPGMVARVRDAKGAVTGLHRTYLSLDGRSKAPVPKPRKMLGRVAGGAVHLAEPAQGLLGLAEGIETALAVSRSCPALPVWATLSAGNLEVVALPQEVRRVVILADHDASGAGRLAAETAARRLRAEGRRVWIALPPRAGEDFNDLLLREGPEAVRAAVEGATEWVPAEPAPILEPVPDARTTVPNLPVGFPSLDGRRPVLRADTGDLAALVDRARAVLAARNQPPWLFRMGAVPAWVARDDDGRAMAVHLNEERFKLALAQLVDWRKQGRNGEPVPAYPPAQLVKALLATPDPDLPVLAGIVAAPVFGRSGELLTDRGYHPGSRLLHEPPEGFVLPAVPDRPSTGEIAAARSLLLDEMLGDFPFTGEAERAHALALLLLPFVRPMIDGPTPLHLIEKPTPGTGATLMVDAIAIVTTGCSASIMTEGRDEEEWRKRLTAKLREAPLLAVIDNLRRPLDAAPLAAALTAPYWEDRILGRSDMARMPVRCAWVATGNNPRLSNEIARRAVRIRLDAHVDRPWQRDGFRHPNLLAWVQANRGRLVAACLTLGRAWVAAGRPRPRTSGLGSFESWSETLGGILETAGVPGFLANAVELYEASDAEGIAWRSFVGAWWDRHGTAPVGTADLFEIAGQCEPPLPLGDGGERSQRTRLGRALGQMRDRVFALDGLRVRLLAAGVSHQAQRWQLAVAEMSLAGGEPGERHPAPLSGERGEPVSGSSGTTWAGGEPGERQPDLPHPGTGEPADSRSPRRSPLQPLENEGSGERGEGGEPFSMLTHARTRPPAHMCEGEAGTPSPSSPRSPGHGNPTTWPGERPGEPDSDVPPAPGYDALFDIHGLDPLSDEDRAQAMRLWLAQGGTP